MMRKLALSVALASLSSAALALGFGEIRLQSGLNQSLKADIPLLSVDGVELDKINVKLASSADFARVGAERLVMLDGLQFKVVERNGRAFVEVRSKTSLREPFLDFVVEMSWPQGRVLRQFTLLLDPPVFSADANGVITQVSRPSSPSNTSSTSRRTSTDSQVKAAPKPRRVATQSRADLSAIQGDSYRTKSSDNLWKIANRSKPANLSVQQMMEAIYLANPDAFANQDMNQLKSDQMLKIPGADDAMKLSGSEAKALVSKEQAPATAKAANTAPAASGSKRSDLVGPDGKPVDSLSSAPEGRLQLASVGASDKAAGSDGLSTEGGANSEASRVQSELVRSQEAMETVNRENTELKARLEEMTAKMQALEKQLVTIKSPELAAMTNPATPNATDTASQPVAADPATSSSTTGVATQTTEPTAATADPTATATPGTDPAALTTTTTATSTTSGSATETAPAPVNTELQSVVEQKIEVKPVQRDKPVSLETDSVSDEDIVALVTKPENYPYLGIGAGLLAILSYFLLRRRKMQKQVSEPVFTHGAQSQASSLQPPKLELREPQPAPAQAAHKASMDLADVMSEVDIYVAYGRFSQAETLLRDALSHAPDRLEIKMKLLECLGQMGRADEFDQLAEEIRTSHGADPMVLAQIDEQYQAAWPGEPRNPAADEPVSLAKAVLDADKETVAEPEVDFSKLSFDEPVVEKAELPPLSFELDETDKPAKKASGSKAGKNSAAKQAGAGLSLAELDLDSASQQDDPLSDGLAASLDEPGLDSLTSDEDAAMTKLHLAEAYIDMGDLAGARDILTEVLQEGNSQQRKEAQNMLDKIV